MRRHVGERRIEIVLQEIVVVERTSKHRQRVLDRSEIGEVLVLALDFRFARSDYRTNSRQDKDLVRIAVETGGAFLDVAVIGFAFIEIFVMDEDRVSAA